MTTRRTRHLAVLAVVSLAPACSSQSRTRREAHSPPAPGASRNEEPGRGSGSHLQGRRQGSEARRASARQMGGDTPRARAGTLREGLGLPPARRQAATAARRFTCRHTTPGKWLRFQVEDEEGTRTLSFDDLNGWFEERFRRARAGKPELLQIQLVRRSLGWGCEFPDYYVGTDPNMEQGTPCVDPEPERLLPKATRSGWTRIVEGYFTGVVRPWRPEDPPEDEEENCGQPLHEFRVLRVLDLEPPEGLLARIVGTCRPVDGNEEPRATRRTTSRRHPLPAHQH